MYCTKCGKFLSGNENFCSNCGTKVEPAEIPSVKDDINAKKEDNTKSVGEKKTLKMITPDEEMVWNVREFPKSSKGDEAFEIVWRSEDMFLHKEIAEQKSAEKQSVSFAGKEEKDSLKTDKGASEGLHRGINPMPEMFRSASEKIENSELDKNEKNLPSHEKVEFDWSIPENKDREKRKVNLNIEPEKQDEDEFLGFKEKKTIKNIVIKERNRGKSSVITRNTEPIVPEYLDDEKVVDIQQPETGGIALEVIDENEGLKVEKVIVDEPNMISRVMAGDSIKIDKIEEVKEETETDLDSQSENLPDKIDTYEKTDEEEIDADRKKTLFDEISPEAVEILRNSKINEEKKQIDKFYTFNKNKEDFQRLLDREYERIENKCDAGGFENDISSFMDVKTGTDVEATSQVEEMARARTMFFEDSFYIPTGDDNYKKDTIEDEGLEYGDDSAVSEEITLDEENNLHAEIEEDESKPQETVVSEVITEDDLVKKVKEKDNGAVQVVFEPNGEETLAETLIEQEAGKTENEQETIPENLVVAEGSVNKEDVAETSEDQTGKVGKLIIDPHENRDTETLAKEFFEDDDEKEEYSIGAKILIGILILIIVVAVAIVGIRIAMPNSQFSKTIDNFADKTVTSILNLFGGEEDGNSKTSNVRDTLLEDKTSLIELQEGKNYKNNIEEIVYDETALYDSSKDYGLSNLKDAKDIQTNMWYTDATGKVHLYDEELVGTVIDYTSKRQAFLNDGDKAILMSIQEGTPVYSAYSDDEKKATGSNSSKFEKLGIGDIKVAGNSYFVFVNETVDGETSAKVYEIKESDKKLMVTDEGQIQI